MIIGNDKPTNEMKQIAQDINGMIMNYRNEKTLETNTDYLMNGESTT